MTITPATSADGATSALRRALVGLAAGVVVIALAVFLSLIHI